MHDSMMGDNWSRMYETFGELLAAIGLQEREVNKESPEGFYYSAAYNDTLLILKEERSFTDGFKKDFWFLYVWNGRDARKDLEERIQKIQKLLELPNHKVG